MAELLGRRPDIDAVFAASDLMALGEVRTIHDQGRTVPEDVAVVGFDDLPQAAAVAPALTTIRQPARDMGLCLADCLVHLIDRPDLLPIQVALPR